MRKITVGFLGCGNIGCGVWKLLHEFENDLQHRSGVSFEVKRILVRDVNKKRDEVVPASLLTTDSKEITDDPAIEMVVEFMGGEEPATQYMLRALEMGKTVVTANKMALALNWHLLQEAAEKHQAGLYYEAAVCGAIPVIRTTIDSLQAKVNFDAAGAVTSDVAAGFQTKNQLGENYGMVAWGGAIAEWNEQAASFAAYVTGKTADEVAGIAVDEGTKPTEADLVSSVTIAVGGFQALIAKAMQ